MGVRWLQAGHILGVREKALAYLVTQWLSQSFFDVLRTEEQLGYLAHMSTLRLEAFFFFTFDVTSIYDPCYVLGRMQRFLEARRRQPLSADKLNELKDAAVVFLKQSPKSLMEDFFRNLLQIQLREYKFDLHQQMVQHIM